MKIASFFKASLLGVLLSLVCSNSVAALDVDPGLESYKKTSGVTGSLNSIGSDTLNNLMTLWAEDFRKIYPNVSVQIEGKGSSTAPPALISGTAQLGPMSRAMKSKEVDEFEKKFGYQPTPVRVAVDALAVFVHKDNPIKGLTIAQVDAVFSKNRLLGGKKDIVTWGDLGLTGEWANKPISTYGRNSASGTYGYFKKVALGNGDFKNTVKEQPGSASVVQSVSVDKYALGYSGIGYKTAGVRAVPLVEEGIDFVDPTAENAYNGSYPLARFLYVYVNKPPEQGLKTLEKEFVRLVLSKKGQEFVVKDGYYPISATLSQEEMGKLQSRLCSGIIQRSFP